MSDIYIKTNFFFEIQEEEKSLQKLTKLIKAAISQGFIQLCT